MRALLDVEVVEVGEVLEVVRVDLAVLGGGVRQHVVGELLDDQGVALFFEQRCDGVGENLCVRRRRGGHDNRGVLGRRAARRARA